MGKGWRGGGLPPAHPQQVDQVTGGRQASITLPGNQTEFHWMATPRKAWEARAIWSLLQVATIPSGNPTGSERWPSSPLMV